MHDAQPSRTELRDISALWWVTITMGVLSSVAGVIVLAKPDNSLATIAVITGIFIVVDGIVALVSAISPHTDNRGLAALIGVINLVIGVVLIRHPVGGVTAVAVFVGIWLIAMGALRFVLAFSAPGHRAWRALVGVVEMVAGIVIVASPKIGIATLALLIGLSLIANGVALVGLGFVMRSAGHEVEANLHGASGTA